MAGQTAAWLFGAAACALMVTPVLAMSLPDAIALAQKSNPGLMQRRAQADAALARLAQATAGRLPTVTLSGEAGTGQADLGGFFGFGRNGIHPEQASVEVRQPIFAGGGINAAIERARQEREAALQSTAATQAALSTEVATAYVAVIDAQEQVRLVATETRQVKTLVDQARLRFKDGEIARTDVSQAEARLAEIAAAQAEAESGLARARFHFQTLVGVPADSLQAPAPALDAMAGNLDEAVAAAEDSNPVLLGAQANLWAAEAGVQGAKAARLPSVALIASAASQRDQFFPGYHNDGYTVGLQGRWTLFSGGRVTGQIDEADAGRRAARAGVDAARNVVREAVVGAWEDVAISRQLIEAATDQAAAADSAADSAAQEVRVGQRPLIDLLRAERDALAAQTALVAARGNAVVASYRLHSLLSPGP